MTDLPESGAPINPRHLPPPRVMKVADVAVMFDVPVQTAARWLAEGTLPSMMLDGQRYCSREQLVGLVEDIASEDME